MTSIAPPPPVTAPEAGGASRFFRDCRGQLHAVDVPDDAATEQATDRTQPGGAC